MARTSHTTAPSVGSVYHEMPVLRFGGLNNRDASIHIADDQSQDLMNVHFDVEEALTKKNGYTRLTASAIDTSAAKSLFTYYKSNGTRYILAAAGTSIYDVTTGTSKAIKTGLTGANKRFTAAVYQDTLYMVNGSDGVMKWDGTNFSTVAGLPFANVKFIIQHKNRMYYIGDVSSPSRVWFSDLGAPETVQGLSFFDINTNDGDVIMGAAEHLDSLVLFKERSLHVLRGTGPQNFVVVDSHEGKGTVSHWTIVSILNHLFYLARDGVYYFDGKQSHLASDLIKGSVFGINGATPWNQQYLSNACAAEYQNKYWLSVTEGPTQATNNRIYLLNYINKKWTRYDTPVSCFTVYQDPTTQKPQLYSGSPLNGIIYHQDTGNSDDGAVINDYYLTKDFDFGAPAHYKSYKGLFFYAEQQAQNYGIQITYIQDLGRRTSTKTLKLGGSAPSQFGTAVFGRDPWGSKPNVARGTTAVSGASRYLSFKVSDGSTNPYTFLGWIVRYKVKRRMQ